MDLPEGAWGWLFYFKSADDFVVNEEGNFSNGYALTPHPHYYELSLSVQAYPEESARVSGAEVGGLLHKFSCRRSMKNKGAIIIMKSKQW